MPFTIIRNDITKLFVDAVVNAANTSLQQGGGVCGAIFKAAGADRLQKACDKFAPIKTGEAVITGGFDLQAKYIIHTAGPVWRGGGKSEEEQLRDCYINSLELAAEHGCESVAFPLISSGIYGYPKAEALKVAVDAIRGFIEEHDIEVSLVVFDKEALAVSENLMGKVKNYIDENFVTERQLPRRRFLNVEEVALFEEITPELIRIPAKYNISDNIVYETSAEELYKSIDNLDETFSATLLRLIDATGMKDSEIYNRANIDRKLFSKIRNNKNYSPSKTTVLAFAVALELTLEQTRDLLKRAGFALSRSRVFDVIIEFFIKNRIYDIFEINEVLFSYDQPLLGG